MQRVFFFIIILGLASCQPNKQNDKDVCEPSFEEYDNFCRHDSILFEKYYSSAIKGDTGAYKELEHIHQYYKIQEIKYLMCTLYMCKKHLYF